MTKDDLDDATAKLAEARTRGVTTVPELFEIDAYWTFAQVERVLGPFFKSGELHQQLKKYCEYIARGPRKHNYKLGATFRTSKSAAIDTEERLEEISAEEAGRKRPRAE